jgi:hypothetical protein
MGEVFGGGVGQLAYDLVGGRVVDILLAAAAALDEFTVDVEAELRVSGRGGHGVLR